MKSIPEMRNERPITDIAAIEIRIILPLSRRKEDIPGKLADTVTYIELTSSKSKTRYHACGAGSVLRRAFLP